MMSDTRPVASLLPHESESGLVTETEIHLARRWIDSVTTEFAWLDGWLGTDLPFRFRYDGVELDARLHQWRRTETSLSEGRQTVQWTDDATGFVVKWRLRRFEEFPAVEWLLTLENTGASDTPLIEDVQALRLRLNHAVPGGSYTVRGVTGGRSFADDMLPFTWNLPSSDGRRETLLGGDYPSSNRHLPFFNLETPEHRGVLVGIGWSGQWQANLRAEGTELHAQAGLKETRFVLYPGESVRTARVLLVFWQGERLHGQNVLRRLLHRRYIPPLAESEGQERHPQTPLVSVNVCFTHHGKGGFLHQATEKDVASLVEPFARLGAELLIIDAGWYDGEPWHDWLGNWKVSRSKYPNGFRSIAESLSRSGLRFGLWFASEHVSKTAPMLKEHPEWVRQHEPGVGGTLRMELPEARQWFLQQVDDLIVHEGMTCYRQDGASGRFDDAPDRKGLTESHHLAGLYTVWDTLRERYPDMVMEGCSGGGRRIDLETLSRFHWHQKSDRWYDSESDQCSLYGANLFLPGGVINIPTERADDYGAWSSFAGQFCPGWHPLDADFPMETARRQVERYKRIRGYLCGDFYPLTPCSLDEPWIGYQFHRADLNAGFALLFKRTRGSDALYPVSDRFLVRLRGLEPVSAYRVRSERTSEENVATGEALAEGFDVILRETPGAELLIYELSG